MFVARLERSPWNGPWSLLRFHANGSIRIPSWPQYDRCQGVGRQTTVFYKSFIRSIYLTLFNPYIQFQINVKRIQTLCRPLNRRENVPISIKQIVMVDIEEVSFSRIFKRKKTWFDEVRGEENPGWPQYAWCHGV